MRRSKSTFKTEDKSIKSLCLYSVLCIDNDAGAEEIKKAYYKQALLFHPDKISSSNPTIDPQEATEKFQQLGLAYQILSSETHRQHYDLTGEYLTEEFIPSEGVNWKEYFKSIFSSVTFDAIEKVRLEYQGNIFSVFIYI